MSKKDFVLIAKTIRELGLRSDEQRHVAICFGSELIKGSSRFDLERFLATCGLDKSDTSDAGDRIRAVARAGAYP